MKTIKITLEGSPEEIAAYEMALKDGKSKEVRSTNSEVTNNTTVFKVGDSAVD